jgi:hypothetical protein
MVKLPPEALYHYTSQAGLLGIMESCSLWATNINYVNDATEFHRPLRMLRDRLADEAASREYEAKHFRISSPARSGHVSVIADRAKHLWTTLNKIQSSISCITCFCEDGDLLSQWRSYTTQSYGYSIGFKTAILKARAAQSGFILGQCIYDPDLQTTIIDEALGYLLRLSAPDDEQGQIGELLNVLKHIALFKHLSFSQEKEWRMVSVDSIDLKRTHVFALENR